jgi:transcriptional regulator with XRE-family HTH domain
MEKQLLNTVGKRIRILRQDMGYSQEGLTYELANIGVEMGRSYISELERTGKVPSGDIIAGLAKVLGTTTDYLLLMTEDPFPSKSAETAIHIEEDVDPKQIQRLIDEFSDLPQSDQTMLIELATKLRAAAKPRIIGDEP